MCWAATEEYPLFEAEVRHKQRRQDIPGIGPLIATAIEALAPPSENFRSGRDFAAWIGLTPVQRSTGGKERLGRTSRMGERTLRRLLIFAASAVVRRAKRKGAPPATNDHCSQWQDGCDRRLLRQCPRMAGTSCRRSGAAATTLSRQHPLRSVWFVSH